MRNSLWICLAVLFLGSMSPVCAQKKDQKLQKRDKFEYSFDLPVYVEQLKRELTYPMAWGNSPIKNFDKWKAEARKKVFECMMTPPRPAASFNMEVLAEEQRDG